MSAVKRTASNAGFRESFKAKRKFLPRIVQDEMKVDDLQQQVRKLKKANAADVHAMNNSVTTALTNAGFVTYLSTIAIGDDNADRSGASINPLHFQYWHLINSGGTSTQAIRFIIFQDKQSYGAAPAVLDVLQTADVSSQYNIPNMLAKRFKILKDYTMCGVVGTAGATTGTLVQRKATFKKLNKVNFTGTTAAVASAGSNAVYLLGITSAAANVGTHNFHYQIKFNA